MCCHSSILNTRGFGLSRSVGNSLGSNSDAAALGRATYGALLGNDSVITGSLVMKGQMEAFLYGKGTDDVDGGTSIGYRTCTCSTTCTKNQL